MLRNFLSFMSVFLFLLTIIPLALSSIHWLDAPLAYLLSYSIYFPCVIGAAGIVLAALGMKGELQFYLILANSLSLGLYLINIFLLAVTA
ncbi:hypothetical protein QWY14_03120 [Planococcus sp. N028]|uniref:Uncharacterized protein n=1 Tax=Planococcus shixiaomingii TaxID=3058393 RepID=A0ABT8MYP4_9BACL|nr:MULTISPECIES: hypothetical protein [unclassified Planococcus (in: firmicutes)]MDN7240761.1 hypothetical protein [Planococcus sp. N028]WKA56667.1 hypothetical protein QWY21_10060 [Planococcus sp. N022]